MTDWQPTETAPKEEAEMKQKKISRIYAAGLDPSMDLEEAILALAERITKLEDKTDEN